MSAKLSTGTEAKLHLTFNSFSIPLIFIKLRYYDFLLMKTPYKLFANSANMTQEHISVTYV